MTQSGSIRRVVAANDRGLEAAATALLGGRPVVVPTDTVYGIAARAADPAMIDRLFELKQRPAERAVAVLVASIDQARQLATLSEDEVRLAEAFWPGALTIVLTRRPDVDASLGRNDGTIGLRCPADAFVRSLANEVGALATTSANVSGDPTPANAIEAADRLAGDVAVVVEDGDRSGSASTVVKLVDGEPVVFRSGPVTIDQIRKVIHR